MLRGNQDVADIYQIEGVVVGADVVDDVVAAGGSGLVALFISRGGGAGEVSLVALHTSLVGQPFSIDAVDGAVQSVLVSGAGSGGALVDGQSGDGSVKIFHSGDLPGSQTLGSGLSGGDGCGLLLVGVGGVALVVSGAALQELGGAHVVGVEGVGGVSAVVLRLGGT